MIGMAISDNIGILQSGDNVLDKAL